MVVGRGVASIRNGFRSLVETVPTEKVSAVTNNLTRNLRTAHQYSAWSDLSMWLATLLRAACVRSPTVKEGNEVN